LRQNFVVKNVDTIVM